MSWLFSRALVEEYSAGTSLDGEPCAQLNVTPTQHKFWRNDKTMDASDLSRFGLTLRLLTAARGAELLMSYLAAFHAKTSAQPVLAPALKESAAASGPTWRASFATYSREASTWKTAQCSLLADSDEFSETWPKWGSMRNGESFLRPIPALLTCVNEFGSWPTPIATEWKNGRGKTGNRPAAKAAKAGLKLSEAVRLRPDGSTGQLNPQWVEWLMGWPQGWTALSALETAKFREWQKLHGGY